MHNFVDKRGGKQCEICGSPGQRHHIVFRSQGGLNIDQNFIYLCPRHHTDGHEAVHNNREFDMLLKLMTQRSYERLFPEEEYQVPEIAKKIGYDARRLAKRMKAVPQRAGKYGREDIIRFLMGGRLYAALGET